MPSTPSRMRTASIRPGFLARRQVDLGRVAGDDHARALAEAGQEHLHLHRGGVLRLVEQHDGVGQRAAAHEGEGRDLDHAGLQAALDVARLHEVVERVVDRAQVGIDLLAHVAGQEAEPLAGLDRRARQDQALGLALLEERDRVADGEPGLAGAGRALGEDELVLLERLDVGVLRGVAGAHRAALAGRDLVEGGAARRLGASAAGTGVPWSVLSWIAPSTSPSVSAAPSRTRS